MEVKIFDNIAEIVRDDMETTISKGSKVSVAISTLWQKQKDLWIPCSCV